jgi:hypothetical protein
MRNMDNLREAKRTLAVTLKGVVGCSIGIGRDELIVSIPRDGLQNLVPSTVRGVTVRTVVTGATKPL